MAKREIDEDNYGDVQIIDLNEVSTIAECRFINTARSWGSMNRSRPRIPRCSKSPRFHVISLANGKTSLVIVDFNCK